MTACGAGVARLAGVGGDQVVGLVARQLDAMDAEGRRGGAHQLELRNQVLRRRRAVGLVLVIEVVAERLLRMVEHHGQVGRRIGLGAHVDQQLPQHVAEAGDRPDGQAVALARQRRQGVIGAEDIARPVHQIQMAFAGLGFRQALGPRNRLAQGFAMRARRFGARAIFNGHDPRRRLRPAHR